MTPNIQPIAWTPDADPTTPGVIADVVNLLPTVRGYAPDFAAAEAAGYVDPLPVPPISAFLSRASNGVIDMFAATADKLYRVGYGAAPVDKSRTTGAYSPTFSYSPWAFANFQNAVLAGSVNNTLQYLSSAVAGGPFVDVSGAPAPATMTVQRNFVICAGFGGATPSFGHGDGWWCSAQEDPLDWTPDIATQCARGRLTATPGAVVRLIAFQDSVIAFKAQSMYRGVYTGPTANTWSWPLLSASVGIVAPDAVVQAGDVLYWIGLDGVYRYNGAGIERIASAPWQWILGQAGGSGGLQYTRAQWDSARRVVRWYVQVSDFYGWAFGIAYHPDTDRWGRFETRAAAPVQVPLQTVPAVVEYASIATGSTLLQQVFTAGFFDFDTRTVRIFAGTPGATSFTTGDIGDDDLVTGMYRGRTRFLRSPTTSTMTHYHRKALGDALTTGETIARDDGKYDVSHASRWHRMQFTQTGMYEVTGFSVGPVQAGRR